MTSTLDMLTILVTGITGDGDGEKPDSLVANRYRTGRVCIPFHADDEELFGGKHKPIRILSVQQGNPNGN